MTNRFDVRKMTTIAVLAALSSILYMIEIPVVLFYKLDVSNLAALLGTFAHGPLAGGAILLIKDLTGLLHSSSAGVGELADFLAGVAMIVPAALFYRAHKGRKSALTGMGVGTLAATVVSMFANMYVLIPFYGVSMETLVRMGQGVIPAIQTPWQFILLITAPFNLLKGLVVSLVTFLIYKPLSPILHGRGLTRRREG